MTIDDVISTFVATGCTLPRASMQWALDHWDEAGPALIDLIDRYARGDGGVDGAAEAVFFAVHLIGHKADPASFPALCRLMRAKDACEEALGVATTETLPQIIVSTFDGDRAALAAVIEDAEADDFVRHGALMAMAYLAKTRRISDADMRAYVRHLYAEMRPQRECPVWQAWVVAVAALGYAEFRDLAERLFRRGFIDSFAMRAVNFHDELKRTLADQASMSGFEPDRIAPFGDAIETLSQWYYFTAKYQEDQARAAARRAVDLKYGRPDFPSLAYALNRPYINDLRDIGRNDPCLCGSGKKYKKCCLGKKEAAANLIAAQ